MAIRIASGDRNTTLTRPVLYIVTALRSATSFDVQVAGWWIGSAHPHAAQYQKLNRFVQRRSR